MAVRYRLSNTDIYGQKPSDITDPGSWGIETSTLADVLVWWNLESALRCLLSPIVWLGRGTCRFYNGNM